MGGRRLIRGTAIRVIAGACILSGGFSLARPDDNLPKPSPPSIRSEALRALGLTGSTLVLEPVHPGAGTPARPTGDDPWQFYVWRHGASQPPSSGWVLRIEDGPLAKAGLRTGDTIVGTDGRVNNVGADESLEGLLAARIEQDGVAQLTVRHYESAGTDREASLEFSAKQIVLVRWLDEDPEKAPDKTSK
jgi:hypothetical protein